MVLEAGANTKQTIAKVEQFFTEDDVICALFFEAVIFVSEDGSPLANDELINEMKARWPVKIFSWMKPSENDCEGPFFMGHEGLHSAWRLYPDPLDCFFVSVMESSKDGPT